MRLKRPSILMFIISLICGILALLPVLGLAIVILPMASFWLMTIVRAFLMAGVILRGPQYDA